MKARYHKFTGDVPVVFVQDAKKFISSLGVPMNETSDKVNPDFMHEVDISGVKMLVFSEGLLRTLYGARVTPIIESHLALWKGTQRHPDNTLAAFKYAMSIAERFNRPKCHELLRRKLAEMTRIELPPMAAKEQKKNNRPVEDILFKEDKIMHIDFESGVITEALSVADMKKKIVTLIKSAEDDVLRKVFSFLNRDSGEYDKTLKTMTDIGIPEKYARQILDFSLETGDFDIFTKYMQKRTLTLKKLDGQSDFISAAKTAIPGLSDQFAAWLINYQWPTTPAMGAGEAALVILLKDGNKPAKGDVGIGNRELEVKGDNGRLKGQHGYGTPEQASNIFAKRFEELMKKVPAAKRIPVPKGGGTEYNPTKTGNSGWAANDLARVCVAEGAAKKGDIVKIWQEAIQSLFHKMSVGWVSRFVSNSGEINNITGFLTTWLAEAAKYYHKTEGFEAILLLSRKGKFKVLMPSDFDKLGDLVKWSPPNFSSRAGSQASTFGITVK